MPAEMDEIMKMAAQILPAIILNTEAKFWNDYVLSFVRAGTAPMMPSPRPITSFESSGLGSEPRRRQRLSSKTLRRPTCERFGDLSRPSPPALGRRRSRSRS